jgi:hypothetical protein
MSLLDADLLCLPLTRPYIWTSWYVFNLQGDLGSKLENLQGNPDMNLDAEIAKTEERLAAVNLDADKLRTTQAKPDYEKTPAAVKEANADKVCPCFIAGW